MISVVIPTFNEEGMVGRCIESVRAENADCEIIVVDGGSRDQTVSEAEGFGDVLTVQSERGRGLQLNAGAAAARGDVLLFLHVDTVLEEGWSVEVLSAFEEEGVVGGAFTFMIDSPGLHYRITEQWVKLRCTFFALPYGDQGIFVKRDFFEKIEGFRDIPIMEDVDLVERMKKFGRISIKEKKAYTHARKWMREGWFRTSVRNQSIMAMYRLGVHPRRLARIYYRGT
ncbi:MAG: TIGR04283 family arsenosugar biosynthesis glycosyltransferase [Candidatus Sulfobium sp.]|jgi:rSAM/selenodomain-associated transferase 2